MRRLLLPVLGSCALGLLAVQGEADLAGARSRPQTQGAFQQVGIASWYGPGFHGRRTASGEIFDQYGLTAAHRKLPLGTEVKVTNLENGRSILVEINDRGPYVKGRVIDLSKAAARRLGIVKVGLGRVRVEATPRQLAMAGR
jgi:rare lipoprotein A